MNVSVLGAVLIVSKRNLVSYYKYITSFTKYGPSTPGHSRKRPLLVTQLDFSLPVMITFFEFPRY